MNGHGEVAVYDKDLKIEAYYFRGMAQPFPNHFHDHYVIGLMEAGERLLSCRGRTYMLKQGDILLLNPGDSHGCEAHSETPLYYRSLQIPRTVIKSIGEELADGGDMAFAENVISDSELAGQTAWLHDLILEDGPALQKEEGLLLLLSGLFQKCGQGAGDVPPDCAREVELACTFMESNFAGPVSLAEICGQAGVSKSTLLRAFAKAKGVTPYGYLMAVRIQRAKDLLAAGAAPVDAAFMTGFSDQSHFTNCFRRMIGLTPGAYRGIFCSEQIGG